MSDVGVLVRAQQRARRLYPRSKGYQGAYVAGARAAFNGRSASTCPYRERAGDATWRKAWRLAWLRGHRSVGAFDEET